MTWKAAPARTGAKATSGEVLRIAASLAAVCALGALILGFVFVGTDRYQRAAALRSERRAITELLQLDAAATVTEVRQYLAPGGREVVYQSAPFGETAAGAASGAGGRGEAARGGAGSAGAAALAQRLIFTLDGRLVRREGAVAPLPSVPKGALPLGREFQVSRNGRAAGFVVEGIARGYKNRIRFLVGLTPTFEIAGVRVVEHEEDPGLGAEVATPWFQGQFLGRVAARLPSLTVTRDPMPEDWRSALATLARMPLVQWRARYAPLLERERVKPIYAVTGATISSRALTDGVRATVDHFRRRWELVGPYLEGAS